MEGNQPLPGAGDPSTWAPLTARRPLFAALPLVTNIATTASRGAQRLQRAAGEHPPARRGTASSSWPPTRSAKRLHQQPRLLRLGRRGRRRRVLGERLRLGAELRSGVPRRAAQLRVLRQLRAALGQGPEVGQRLVRRHRTRSSAAGRWRAIFQARTGFPITVHDGRAVSAGRAWRRAAELHRRPRAVQISRLDQVARHQRLRRGRPGHLRRLRHRHRAGARATSTSTSPSRSASTWAARYLEFRVEAFNLTNTPSFGPPGARHRDPPTRSVDHEHRQRAARHRAGREVLLLIEGGLLLATPPHPPARSGRRESASARRLPFEWLPLRWPPTIVLRPCFRHSCSIRGRGGVSGSRVSWTTWPPTTVTTALMSLIRSAGTARKSSDSTTRSPSFPTSIEPFLASSKLS